MRILKLNEAIALDDGTYVEAISGVVREVGQRYSGQGKYGPWSFQSLLVDDGTATATVKLKSRGAVTEADLLNRRIVVSAAQGKKGLTGIKVELDEYEGRTSKILMVTNSANIERAGEAPPAQQRQTATTTKPAFTDAGAPKQAPPVPHAETGDGPEGDYPDEGGGMTEAQKLLAARKAGSTATTAAQLQKPSPATTAAATPPATVDGENPDVALAVKVEKLRRLRTLTLNAACRLVMEAEQAGITPSPEHLQAIDSWMAIELVRSGALSLVGLSGEPPRFDDFRAAN